MKAILILLASCSLLGASVIQVSPQGQPARS
jgi:hypothetical protein